MNRRELVNAAAAQTGMQAREMDAALKGLTDVITAVASKGEQVVISGFAKFAKIERAARMGRNPATGEAIRIKASKKARLTPLKAFKDAVMTPSLAPKLAQGVWPPAPAKAKAASSTRAVARKAPTKAVAVKRPAAAAKRAPAKKAPAKKAPAKRTASRR